MRRTLLPVGFALGVTTGWGCGGAVPGQVVRSIEIEGAEQVDEEQILEHLATEETPRAFGVFRMPWTDPRTLDENTLQRDLQRIERYYRARGYYDAHVESTQVVPVDPDDVDPQDGLPEEVDIFVRVVEGRPVEVRSILLRGTEHLEPRFVWKLGRIDRIEVGDRFDERAYDRQKAVLENALLDEGYARAKVEGRVRVDPAEYAADVVFTLRPGVQCTVGEIRVFGLEEVSEDRLRAAYYIEEGERYSASALVEAQKDIYALGVFSSVDVRPDLGVTGSVIPIVIKVQESDAGRIRLGFGAQHSSEEFEFHGVAGWQHRNLFGGLQSLEIQDKPAFVFIPSLFAPEGFPSLRNRLELELRWPGIPERRTTLFHTGNYTFGPPEGPDHQEYSVHDLRLELVGFERPIVRKLVASLVYHFEFAITTEDRPSDFVYDDFMVTWLEQRLVLDLRDSPLLTRRGGLLSLSVGEKPDPFIGRADFYRVVGEARGYTPIAHPFYLAARFRAGRHFVTATSDFGEQPQTLLFASGGTSSNRGYPLGSIRPETPISPATDCDDESARPNCIAGGLLLWEASAEIRWELPGPFRLVAFADASDAFLPGEGLDLARHHLSVGPGFRWDSILGAVRADIGFRTATKRHPGERVLPWIIFGRESAFEVSLGIGDAF